jgi:hypothetical protein
MNDQMKIEILGQILSGSPAKQTNNEVHTVSKILVFEGRGE